MHIAITSSVELVCFRILMKWVLATAVLKRCAFEKQKAPLALQSGTCSRLCLAADPDYVHQQIDIQNGPVVHLLFDPETANEANWELLKTDYLQRYFDFMAANFGAIRTLNFHHPRVTAVPEYPMCTMIWAAVINLREFTGLFVHEANNWYYGVLATNEAAHPWMDEGFTSYAEEECMNVL